MPPRHTRKTPMPIGQPQWSANHRLSIFTSLLLGINSYAGIPRTALQRSQKSIHSPNHCATSSRLADCAKRPFLQAILTMSLNSRGSPVYSSDRNNQKTRHYLLSPRLPLSGSPNLLLKLVRNVGTNSIPLACFHPDLNSIRARDTIEPAMGGQTNSPAIVPGVLDDLA